MSVPDTASRACGARHERGQPQRLGNVSHSHVRRPFPLSVWPAVIVTLCRPPVTGTWGRGTWLRQSLPTRFASSELYPHSEPFAMYPKNISWTSFTKHRCRVEKPWFGRRLLLRDADVRFFHHKLGQVCPTLQPLREIRGGLVRGVMLSPPTATMATFGISEHPSVIEQPRRRTVRTNQQTRTSSIKIIASQHQRVLPQLLMGCPQT